MSMYLSFAPMIEQQAVENASALPDAPQLVDVTPPARARRATAAVLRRAAAFQLAVASRLDRRDVRRPVAV